MNEPLLTLPSLLGGLAYIVVAGLAAGVGAGPWRSALTAQARRQWLLVTAVFAALAVWRLGLGEIRFQDSFREWARIDRLYDERYTVQIVLSGAVLLATPLIVVRVLRGGGLRRLDLARLAAIGLVCLSFMRLISLHSIDEVLYRTGPVHLNYLFDMGLTALAGAVALLEIRFLRALPSPTRSRPGARSVRTRRGRTG